ncbi:MAG: hypothetical protein WD598_06160 [Acidimicrobiia bacterium]
MSAESAAYLVDERPAGGWDSLITKDHLRAELAEIRVEIANLASDLRKEMRDQTRWLTGLVLVSITLVATITGAVAGAVARFA